MIGCKVVEVCGNAEDIQSQIADALSTISIAANTTPSIAVAGSIPRFEVIILYQPGA
jgi:hypothetical protein